MCLLVHATVIVVRPGWSEAGLGHVNDTKGLDLEILGSLMK